MREAESYYRGDGPAPKDRSLDLHTRCWQCRFLRYFEVTGEDVWLQDGSWMCSYCIRLMKGWYVARRYQMTHEVVDLLSTRWS